MPRNITQQSSRSWCFTANNPTKAAFPDDFSRFTKVYISDITEINRQVRYAIFQLESAPTTGTDHYQGYAEFTTPVKGVHMQNICLSVFGSQNVHIEKRRGTRNQARDYCRKDDSRVDVNDAGPHEYGTWKRGGQGKRNDLADMVDLIKEGATDIDLIDDYPGQMVRYLTNVQKIKAILAPRRNKPTEVYLIYGPPGVGKSQWVRRTFPDAFWKQPDTKWFDTYQQEREVVFDDFDGRWFKFSTLLRLLDSTPLLAETKGSMVNFSADTILITSNLMPSEWYPKVFAKNPDRLQALHRRIVKWVLYKSDGTFNEFSNYDQFMGAYNAQKGFLPHMAVAPHFQPSTEDRIKNIIDFLRNARPDQLDRLVEAFPKPAPVSEPSPVVVQVSEQHDDDDEPCYIPTSPPPAPVPDDAEEDPMDEDFDDDYWEYPAIAGGKGKKAEMSE